jgi:Xaa-Pro aminopeptidase
MARYTLADRRKSVLDLMARNGVARLVCAGNGHHMIDLSNPVAHLTGYRSLGPALLVLSAGGDLHLLTEGEETAGRASADLAEHRVCPQFEPALSSFLGAPAAGTAFVGLGAMPRRLATTISAALGADAKPIDAQLYAASGRKTDAEIAAARTATTVAEAGYAHMLRFARPGMRECDLAVEVNRHMRRLGANDSFLMLNCGPRADAVMPSSERPIEAGDLLLCELSPSVDGQFTQICRTVSIGAPRPELREKYGLLIAAMMKGIAQVRPGERLGAVCAAIDDDLSAAGYAEFSRPPFIRRRGHGLGCGSGAPGDVSVDNDTILEPGMLFMVHPNQFLPETGYMMCGEPVLVTDTGHEILSADHAELAVVGGKGGDA